MEQVQVIVDRRRTGGRGVEDPAGDRVGARPTGRGPAASGAGPSGCACRVGGEDGVERVGDAVGHEQWDAGAAARGRLHRDEVRVAVDSPVTEGRLLGRLRIARQQVAELGQRGRRRPTLSTWVLTAVLAPPGREREGPERAS